MNDKVVNISFNIWANSEEEGKELINAICGFINDNAQMGVKVSASKITEAIKKWKDNPLIKRSIVNHFK